MADSGNVNYRISLDAADAVARLEALNKTATSFDAKIAETTAKVRELSAAWGTSFKATAGILKNADQEISTVTGHVGVFGQQVFGQLTMADGSVKTITKSLANVGWGQVAQQSEDFGRRAVRSVDAVRIALGVLVSMLIFQVIQAIQNTFTGAIKAVETFEAAIYNARNAEKVLSESGIEISFKNLLDISDRLQKKFEGMFSKVQLQDMVSDIAIATKEVGANAEQIQKIAEASAAIQLRTPGSKLAEIEQQVTKALLSGRTQALQALGVAVSEEAIKEEGMRQGLIKSGQELDKNQKFAIALELTYKSISGELGSLGERQNTISGATQKLSAAWQDFLKNVGVLAAPILIQSAENLLYFLKIANKFFDDNKQKIENFVTLLTGIATVWHDLLKLQNPFQRMTVGDIFKDFKKSVAETTAYFKNLNDVTQDTPTNIQAIGKALIDMSKVNIDSLINSLVSLGDRLSQLDRDFSQSEANYQDEFNTKMSRMQEDYQNDVIKTEQDFDNRRATAAERFHNQQLDAEAKFQEQMRELKERYLFDLEDALRNRDARQVLRLQEQYRMDRGNLERNHANESAAQARQYQQELADLNRQEGQKLEGMAAAERIKEQRAAEDFAREQEQRRQRYENEKADIAKQIDEKLQQLAGDIAKEFRLREGSATAIYDLLKKYYGAGGYFDGLYDYSYNSLVSRSAQMLSALQAIIGQMGALVPPTMVGTFPHNESYRGGGTGYMGNEPMLAPPSDWTGWQQPAGFQTPQTSNYTPPKAKGGVEIARAPTTTTYGEAGPEAAIFLPLSKLMAGMSNVPVNMSGGAGDMGGQLSVLLELSPDLEARITENTLGRAAKVITQVYKGRR